MEEYPDYYFEIAENTGFDLIYRNRCQDASLEVIMQTGIVKFGHYQVRNCGCYDANGMPLENETCIDRFCRRREVAIDCEDNCIDKVTCCNRPGTDPLRQVLNPLCDVRQVEGKGNCLFTLEPIRENAFVMEYVGDILPYSEIAKRKNDEYSVRIKYTSLVIDPLRRGNLSRFASHSHDPNMQMITHRSSDKLQNFLVALKNIHAGDELTFKYNKKIENCKCEPCLSKLSDAVVAGDTFENNYCNQPSPSTSSSSSSSSTSSFGAKSAAKKNPDSKIMKGIKSAKKTAAPPPPNTEPTIKRPRVSVVVSPTSLLQPQQVRQGKAKMRRDEPQRKTDVTQAKKSAGICPTAGMDVSTHMRPNSLRPIPKLIRFYQATPRPDGVKRKSEPQQPSSNVVPKANDFKKVVESSSQVKGGADVTTHHRTLAIQTTPAPRSVLEARAKLFPQLIGPVITTSPKSFIKTESKLQPPIPGTTITAAPKVLLNARGKLPPLIPKPVTPAAPKSVLKARGKLPPLIPGPITTTAAPTKLVLEARTRLQRQIAAPTTSISTSSSRVGQLKTLHKKLSSSSATSPAIAARVPAKSFNRFTASTSADQQSKSAVKSRSQTGSRRVNKFYCIECDKTFETRRKFYEHQRLHAPKTFECPTCLMSFSGKNLLKRHKRIHLSYEERKWVCDNCNLRFSRNEHLLRHLPTCKKPKEESDAA